ncbi:MAG: hypothetical protein AB7V15_04975 [Acidimicrobiia bacterium]
MSLDAGGAPIEGDGFERGPGRRFGPRLVWPAVVLVVAGLVVAVWLSAFVDEEPAPATELGGPPWTLEPYEGLGGWVDVFDYVPALFDGSGPPTIDEGQLSAMSELGIRTLYLQAVTTSGGPGIVEPDIVGRILAVAHEEGVAVVAWYLPFFADLDADLERLRAVRAFEYQGHRFDGIALDIEWTRSVSDHDLRSARLLELSEALDEVVGGEPLGAIVLPPVQLEDVNPALWPGFPWQPLAGIYDVWLPMTYWTFRSALWNDPFAYTQENIRRVRQRVGSALAPVHPIGGVADRAAESDYPGFVEAVTANRSVGWSVYDFRTLTGGGLAILQSSADAGRDRRVGEPEPGTGMGTGTSPHRSPAG